ncbi:peptidoglycan bridge formation glycyltransferase FemA/FemB family protein [Agromyces sp. H66]|uniref:lipid II:glycine glycyltransferase FemX n=1 Tax=Agromyces sp. H66 TaxID=2529859 RepID=UPI00145BFB64|nr:peptidoglycan bridge formation glycyltransferase FemA/FemB family protein [Agromyces sp. H66]
MQRTVTANVVQADPSSSGWDDRILAAHTLPHFMQSSTWEQIRSEGPWAASPRVLDLDRDLPVLAFERHAEGFGTLQHLPRVSGLAPADVPALTERIRAERGGAFATKIEVHQPRDDALVAAFESSGWRPTRASQYRHAIVVETDVGEDELLAGMKKRARAEIRVAERNGVTAGRVELTEENRRRMLELVRETAERSGAFFRGATYLERVWTAFDEHDRGRLYFAWHDGRVVSGAFVAVFGNCAWYKDGGSLRDRPQLMASRFLQWEIMRDLAASGIARYDLGHVPPPSEPHAPGQGVLTFKSAFARDVLEYMPAFHLSHEDHAEAWRRGESEFLAAHQSRTGDYWY